MVKKKILVVLLALCLVFSMAACGNNSGGSGGNSQSEEAGEWTAEGSFVDENENYLLLYHMTVEDGYEEEGWSATAVFGEELSGGTLQDEGGKLAGTIVTMAEDGSIGEETDVTVTQDGDDVILTMNGTEYRFQVDDTDYSEASGDMLPYFSYNEIFGYNDYIGEDRFDSVEAAVYDYLAYDFMTDYDPDHTIIPFVQIIAVEDDDEKDSLIYGNYYVWEFEKNDDTLVAVSGGHYPGVIHAERFGEGDTAIYSAFSMDVANTDDQNRTIMGDYYDTFTALSSDYDTVNSGLAQVISDYVHVNGLDVSKFQIAEGDVQDIL